MPEPKSPYKRVRRAFNQSVLKRVCEMHETDFAAAYSMEKVPVLQQASGDWGGSDFYLFKDNGADILAVAHLDTVVSHRQRVTSFATTAAGPVVHSGALDDRLGAYTILELLPRLGIKVDVLLTVGEEQGRSTAQWFDTEKPYNWMIEFDRGGTDVVMYDYEDADSAALVRASGARMGMGSFSDIAFMEQLEIKGFNWGVGYEDYHGPRGYAYLEDYWMMLGHFMKFHEANAEEYLPHDRDSVFSGWGRRGTGWSQFRYGGWDDDPYTDEIEEWEKAQAEKAALAALDDEPDEGDLVSDDFNIVNDRLLAAGGEL